MSVTFAAQSIPAKIFTISAPSGTGKNTTLNEVKAQIGADQFFHSVSDTTRKPRVGEQNGVDYHFISKPRFMWQILTGQMLEWKRYDGNFYGTRKQPVDEALTRGKAVIIDTLAEGVRQIKAKRPDTVSIFMMPSPYGDMPAQLQTIRERMERGGGRNVEARLPLNERDLKEFYADDRLFDHLVVNDHIPDAARDLVGIFRSGAGRAPNTPKLLPPERKPRFGAVA